MVLPVNGTREALFSFVQAAVDPRDAPRVLMPNPFYQIYEGAAWLAGAEPYFLDCTAATGYAPDLDSVPAAVWERCQILFLCSPGNPTGAVLTCAYLRHALELAERYDFIVAADECYAEIYLDEAGAATEPARRRQSPRAATALSAASSFTASRSDRACRGLRSGFVAGDPQLIARFLLYRTYHGSRDVTDDADREHGGVERRCARAREPPSVSGEIRPRAADSHAGARCASACRCVLSLAGRRWR